MKKLNFAINTVHGVSLHFSWRSASNMAKELWLNGCKEIIIYDLENGHYFKYMAYSKKLYFSAKENACIFTDRILKNIQTTKKG